MRRRWSGRPEVLLRIGAELLAAPGAAEVERLPAIPIAPAAWGFRVDGQAARPVVHVGGVAAGGLLRRGAVHVQHGLPRRQSGLLADADVTPQAVLHPARGIPDVPVPSVEATDRSACSCPHRSTGSPGLGA